MKLRTFLSTTLLHAGLGAMASAQEAESATPAPEAERPETVVSRDGTKIAYERTGSGPLVVIVSGALSTGAGLAPLAGLLSDDLTVATYDRRGRGASGDTAPYSVLREVEDLEAVIDATGGRAVLFGVSSGAVLALEAANELGEKVRGAALFEPPLVVDDARPPIPPAFFDEIEALLAEGRRGDAVAAFMSTGAGVPEEQVAAMRRSPMWDALVSVAHTLPYDGALLEGLQGGDPLPRDRWSSLEAPILVLDGERSPAFLRNAAAALAEGVAGAEHRTLPDCDHSAAFMAPQVFVPVLIEFSKSLGDPVERRDADG